jgi:hypothetical protein
LGFIKTRNITFSVLCALILSLIVFLFIIWNLPDHLFSANEQFFSQEIEGENKIFILGSSHVYALNPILISNELEKNGKYFTVYNLGSPGDDFEERERTVEMIIDEKPKIVLYGIEPRAFETSGRNLVSTSDEILPSIPSITKIFDLVEFDKKGILKNPKFALIRTISKPINDISTIENPYPNSPFLTYDKKVSKIVNLDDLYKIERENTSSIEPVGKNSNLLYLKKIISKLQENDIKVILFLTPHSKIFLDYFPENERIIFQEIIDNISMTNKILVHSEIDRYSELNVWHDHTHLAVNNNTDFYSKDVAGFILDEIEK